MIVRFSEYRKAACNHFSSRSKTGYILEKQAGGLLCKQLTNEGMIVCLYCHILVIVPKLLSTSSTHRTIKTGIFTLCRTFSIVVPKSKSLNHPCPCAPITNKSAPKSLVNSGMSPFGFPYPTRVEARNPILFILSTKFLNRWLSSSASRSSVSSPYTSAAALSTI